jgi:ubiquinone/menaquinone biosynthesis C-methylase UbiE
MNRAGEKRLYNFLSKKSATPALDSGTQHRLDMVFRQLVKRRKGGKVLDIGFGTGYLLSKLARTGFEPFGLDISGENVKRRQRELGKKICLKEGSITHIPFGDNFFDSVVALEIIEHLNNADLRKALKEVHRVLSTGGIFIVTTPNEQDLTKTQIMCPHCFKIFSADWHKQSFSLHRLASLLTEARFNVVFGKEIDYPVANIPKILYFTYKKIWRLKKNGLLAMGEKLSNH